MKCYSGHTNDDRDLLAGFFCVMLIGVPLLGLGLLLLWKLAEILGALLFWIGMKTGILPMLFEWIQTR